MNFLSLLTMALYLAFLLLLGSAVCSPSIEDEYREADRAMQNLDLFEGDILGVDPNAEHPFGNAVPNQSQRWPNGIIPYKIDKQFKSKEQLILKAMKNIEDQTCIKFRPATSSDSGYINIIGGAGCFSYVGNIRRPQNLFLGNGCLMHSIIVHELMHAVGFYHEHSRSDRDDYINIIWDNIAPGANNDFRKLSPDENILYDKFDFNSIMMYSDNAFSKSSGPKTMVSKIRGVSIPNFYTKPGVSKSDVYRVQRLYECK